MDRQLQPLIRWHSRRNAAVKLPDQMRMHATAISNADRELEKELGRSPSAREIADYTGLPLNRIEEIRRIDRKVLTGSYEIGEEGDDVLHIEDQAVIDDGRIHASMVAVCSRRPFAYRPEDPRAHSRLDGARRMSNLTLAKHLRLSPGAISQRKAKIQALLDRESELSPFL